MNGSRPVDRRRLYPDRRLPQLHLDHTLLVLGSAVNGIFKSSNGGGVWIPVTATLALPQITALTFSPAFASDQTAFAGTLGKGFLVTKKGGNSWTRANTGITDQNISDIALSPTYPSDKTLWVTTNTAGVFQSTNGGVSWGSPVTVQRQLSDLTTVHYQSLSIYSGIQFLGMFEGLWEVPSMAGCPGSMSTPAPPALSVTSTYRPRSRQHQTIFRQATLWQRQPVVH